MAAVAGRIPHDASHCEKRWQLSGRRGASNLASGKGLTRRCSGLVGIAPPNYQDTLIRWAGEDSVYDRDIVVWYSPRPEDYPVMSNARIGVTFHPDGFFQRNPAVGLGQVSGQ